MNATMVLKGDLDRDPVYASFAVFHGRFAGIFSRPEPRAQAGKHLRALMGPVERRNGWQMVEAVGDAGPGAVQRLLHQAVWSADAAGDRLRDLVIETFGSVDRTTGSGAGAAERQVPHGTGCDARRGGDRAPALHGHRRGRLESRSVASAYYLADAPPDTPLSKLVTVASSRYTIEQCFEEAKDTMIPD